MAPGFAAPPCCRGQVRGLALAQAVGIAAVVMHVVDKGQAQVRAQGQEVGHGVACVVVFNAEPTGHVFGQASEGLGETTQSGLLVPIDTPGVDVDEVRADHVGQEGVVFEFAHGVFHHMVVRRGQDHELVRVEAEANALRLGKGSGGVHARGDGPGLGQIVQGVADLGVGHARKQGRGDAEGPDAKPMRGLHGQEQIVRVVPTDVRHLGQGLPAFQARQNLGRGGAKGNFLGHEKAAQSETHDECC